MKRLVILGSTGSIGTSTLSVVDSRHEEFRVVGLGAGRNVERLEEQVSRYRPQVVCVADEPTARELGRRVGRGTDVVHGAKGMVEVAGHPDADLVVCGLVGAIGLEPTLAAVDAGHDVALANKEALVVGGGPITARAARTGARILPVDSEHNALHQCLRGEVIGEVRRLWLTASGGPFRRRPVETFDRITPDEALRHPSWSMGPKITVDSATMMNKGLEVIEARWLFGLGPEVIRVVVHPRSVVHSMVEFVDGSFKAQLGIADMRHPIQYALTWPERWETDLEPFDPVEASPLEFERPDPRRFPCLDLAYAALRTGGAAPAVLNAANEVAVEAFLSGRIPFSGIPSVIEVALDRHGGAPAEDLEALRVADARARESVSRGLANGARA